jgi:hypothetical protein
VVSSAATTERVSRPAPPRSGTEIHGTGRGRLPLAAVSPQLGNRVEDDDDDGEIDSEVILSLRFLVLREGKKAVPLLKEVSKLLAEIRKDAA